MAPSLPNQLWSHLQKSLLARPAPSLQPFITCDAAAEDAQVSDEILVPVDLLCEAGAAASSTIEEREFSSSVGDDTKENDRPPAPSSVRQDLLQDHKTAVLGEVYPIAFEDDLLLDATPLGARSDYRNTNCEDLHFRASAPIRSPSHATLESRFTGALPTSPHVSKYRGTLIQTADVEGQPMTTNQDNLLEQDS